MSDEAIRELFEAREELEPDADPGDLAICVQDDMPLVEVAQRGQVIGRGGSLTAALADALGNIRLNRAYGFTGYEQLHRMEEVHLEEHHPEDRCQRCGGRNVPSWFVASDRFNASMEALGLDRGAIVCPACFVLGHEKATGLTCSWELQPGTHFNPVEA